MSWPRPHAIGATVIVTDGDRYGATGKLGTVVAYDLRSCCPYTVEVDGHRIGLNDGEIASPGRSNDLE